MSSSKGRPYLVPPLMDIPSRWTQALTFNHRWCAFATVLNKLAAQCRADNDKWWRHPRTKRKLKNRNHGELFMLMVSEISEAMEGHRKDLMDDKLPHRKMVEVELADCLIRIFDYAGEHKLDLGGALFEKRAFNAVRKDHSYAARLGKHGKKF